MAGLVRKAYRRLAQGLPGEPPASKDIDLPLESGQRRDSRLPAKPRSFRESLGEAGKGFKILKDRGLIGGRSQSKR